MALPSEDRQTLLLSVDFEDWHQLVRRRVGARAWSAPGPALARQCASMLELFDELGVRATFFVLGMAARAHPQLVEAVVARGHEVGCHGDAHLPVHTQTPAEFAADLRDAVATIEQLTGVRPIGYRAPAFSITREAGWAYEVLASEGFRYDSSQHDSPRIRRRIVPALGAPHPLETADGPLWEFPVAVWRGARGRLPVGGASYWGAMPTPLVLHGLRQAGALAGLYLHPHELDPEPLRAMLPSGSPPSQHVHGALRAGQRNIARRRAPAVLRAIAGSYRLITYGDAHAVLAGSPAASS